MGKFSAIWVGAVAIVGMGLGGVIEHAAVKKADATAVVSLVAVFNCDEFQGGMRVTRDGQVHYQQDTPFGELDAQAQKMPSGSAFIFRMHVDCSRGGGTGI